MIKFETIEPVLHKKLDKALHHALNVLGIEEMKKLDWFCANANEHITNLSKNHYFS